MATAACADRGLAYLNNRYHDPQLGSFISVDPLVTMTGQPYIYGAANTVTYSDPDGLEPCPRSGCVSSNSGGRRPCGREGWDCDRHSAAAAAKYDDWSRAWQDWGHPVYGVHVGTLEDLLVDDGSGSAVPISEYFSIDGPAAAQVAGDATLGAFVEFGDGRFKAWTDPNHPWYGQVRYFPLRAGLQKSARNFVLGPNGAVASSRLTWAKRGGTSLAVVGVAFDLHEGWELYDDHGVAVRALGTGGRSAASLGGGLGGAALGAKGGAALGGFCGPAAWACVPIGAGTGAVGGAFVGSGAATWLWDQSIGRAF